MENEPTYTLFFPVNTENQQELTDFENEVVEPFIKQLHEFQRTLDVLKNMNTPGRALTLPETSGIKIFFREIFLPGDLLPLEKNISGTERSAFLRYMAEALLVCDRELSRELELDRDTSPIDVVANAIAKMREVPAERIPGDTLRISGERGNEKKGG